MGTIKRALTQDESDFIDMMDAADADFGRLAKAKIEQGASLDEIAFHLKQKGEMAYSWCIGRGVIRIVRRRG